MAYTISQNLNIKPKYFAPVVVHLSAGDSGIPITFSMYDGAYTYEIPSGAVISVQGTRKDGASWITTGTASGNEITFTSPSAMAAVEGAGIAEVSITSGSETYGSANFLVLVERASIPNGVSYSSDPSVFQDILNYVKSGIAQGMVTATSGAVAEWLEENITPTTPAVDASLSVAGAAADAAATGDVKKVLEASMFKGKPVIDGSYISYNNNSAVTNNNDKTYTIGTTDYGRTTFGSFEFPAGAYILYGVPSGYAYLGVTQQFDSAPIKNGSVNPIMFVLDEPTTLHLGFYTGPSKPTESYTIIPYVCQAKTSEAVRYLGVCPSDLNALAEVGIYSKIDVATHSPLPDEYDDTTGFLINYPKTFNSVYGKQILFNTSFNNGTRIWTRTCKSNGESSGDNWQEIILGHSRDAIENGMKSINGKVASANVSLSGNYFDYENAEWGAGFDTGSTITQASGYHYAFAPLQGAGEYIRVMQYSAFGSNCENVCLFDENKNRLKVVTATRIGTTNGFAFTLSENDALQARYITMNHKDDVAFYYSALYFNSEEYPLKSGIECPLPNYKPVTTKLYKSVFVCDGDSIAQANLDKPMYENGWWGRTVRNYSCSGKNFAVGGGTITSDLYYSNDEPRHWVSTSVDAIHSEYDNLDYLILDGGTNDADLIGAFSGNTPPQKFGTWTETDFSGSYDHTTFCGAVEYMFYKALTYWPTAKIGFIIPMEMGTSASSIANRRRYFDEAKKIAKKWHIPVLDLWENSGADARLSVFYDSSKTPDENVTAKSFYNDGQHPTSYGYNKMQNMIEEWILSL